MEEQIRAFNPPHLSDNTYLVNLAKSFNVTSIPLAIIILITIILASFLPLILIMLFVRHFLGKAKIKRQKRRGNPTVYLDELERPSSIKQLGGTATLECSLEYNLQAHVLKIDIISLNDIPLESRIEHMEMYIRATIYKVTKTTKVRISNVYKTYHRRGIRLCWHDLISCELPENLLKDIVIIFEALSYNALGTDHSFGYLPVHLDQITASVLTERIIEFQGQLLPREIKEFGIGQLCIGLCLRAQQNQIEVTIFEAMKMKIDQRILRKGGDLVVEVELRSGQDKQLSSKITRPCSDLSTPYFNEKMIFKVHKENVKTCAIICIAKLCKKMGRKKRLGYIALGLQSPSESGEKMWDEMLKRPEITITKWHDISAKLPKFIGHIPSITLKRCF